MARLAQCDSDVVTIGLDGPLRIVLPSGKLVALSSVKAQGCLALLCTTKDLRHSRVWLADKLWSDKDTKHALGSLRHVLAEIRLKICCHLDILGSDRRAVWLHPGRVRVVRDGGAEFLEGMDICDPEWEEWLRDQRLRADEEASIAQTPSPVTGQVRSGHNRYPGAPALSIVVDRSATGDSRFLGAVVSEILARNILEVADFEVRIAQQVNGGMTLNVSPRQKPKDGAVQLSLRQAESGAFIWSSGRVFTGRSIPGFDDTDFLSLLVEAQDAAIAGHLSQQPKISLTLDMVLKTQLAARKIFTYDVTQLVNAERTLRDVCDTAPSAVSIGWLLVANRVMIFERVATPSKERIQSLEMLCAQGIALGQTNAFLLAAVSGIYLRFLSRPEEAFALARRAVHLNPASPYALDALAAALYLCGQSEEGYRLSRRVRALTANTQNAHFFEMSLCVASILTGRNGEALHLASSATALAPKFRAAWRYSIALHAHEGNFPRAIAATRSLQSIEPDFSVDRLLNDMDYPVLPMRKSSIKLSNLHEILAS